MDPVKVSGVTDWPVPWNLHHVNQFLSFYNFYCQFVEDYAIIVQPLKRLKRKDVPWRWGKEEQETFIAVKAAFACAPVLAMPNMDAVFKVETDASNFAVGAVLLQHAEDGDW